MIAIFHPYNATCTFDHPVWWLGNVICICADPGWLSELFRISFKRLMNKKDNPIKKDNHGQLLLF